MRDRDQGASTMITERTMHVAAPAAIIIVGVALLFRIGRREQQVELGPWPELAVGGSAEIEGSSR